MFEATVKTSNKVSTLGLTILSHQQAYL